MELLKHRLVDVAFERTINGNEVGAKAVCSELNQVLEAGGHVLHGRRFRRRSSRATWAATRLRAPRVDERPLYVGVAG